MDKHMDKNQRRKIVKRRRVVCNLLWLSLIAVIVWLIVASINDSNQHRGTAAELQVAIEEKEVIQREVERLEQVVTNGAFFESDEWVADEVPYYDIPLSLDLQLYTYNRCVDLGISGYYELVLAMMWQESNFNPELISTTNDYGLMQINKCNHDWLSEELGITDFLEPYQSIDAGTHIFASLLLKYADPHKALMAYNFGEAGARKHWDRGTYTSSYSRAISEKQEQVLNKGI